MAQAVRHGKECPNSPILGTTEQTLLHPPPTHKHTLAFLSSLAFRGADNVCEAHRDLPCVVVQATWQGCSQPIAPMGFLQSTSTALPLWNKGCGRGRKVRWIQRKAVTKQFLLLGWAGVGEQALHLSAVLGGKQPRAEISEGFFLQSHTKMENNKGETVLNWRSS